ncbi:MAG: hypothetical protein FWC60_11470 [Firmicutes bacterium]|nr:hypothetical protein [Bacillota bacterium]
MTSVNGKTYFCINVNKYFPPLDFAVVRPASLNSPKDNAVMFIMEKNIAQADVFYGVNHCLIYWPETMAVPVGVAEKHAVYKCADPHLSYCKFFSENNITYYPPMEEYSLVNGAFIAKTAKIGQNPRIFPGAYVGGEIDIGDNVYIGSGVKLVGEIHIGDNVVIRENTVLGADGLTTDRDENGRAVTMPQFGGIVIEDNVQIGANVVICRGAIDHTIIRRGAKISNGCLISHNIHLGADTFVVDESCMFGSCSTGEQVLISGNSTIRNGIHVGSRSIVGMGSVVVKPVENGATVKGNPAK